MIGFGDLSYFKRIIQTKILFWYVQEQLSPSILTKVSVNSYLGSVFKMLEIEVLWCTVFISMTNVLHIIILQPMVLTLD